MVVVLVWCACGAVVVRAGLDEGCHLCATITLTVEPLYRAKSITIKRKYFPERKPFLRTVQQYHA